MDSTSPSGPPHEPSSGVDPDAAQARKRPSARGTAFYPRKRANAACQVCRARKTKCDNRKPSCSYCLSVGATCIQSPVDLSSFDPASLQILGRLDDLERLLRDSQTNSSPEHLLVDNDNASPSQNPGAQPSATPDSSATWGIRDDPDIPLRSILPENVDALLRWDILPDHGTDRPMNTSPSWPSTHSRFSNSSLGSLLEMRQSEMNELLDNFFVHVHCKNPIFDESSTRRLVTATMLDGLDWSPNSCLALVIFALGRIATPLGPSLDVRPCTAAYAESQVFFNAAQKRMGCLLTSRDIIAAQCLFLSGVYMMNIFQPLNAWRFFSQALAACQTLPFLLRAYNIVESVPDYSTQLLEEGASESQEQAVYWSTWKSEREMTLTLALPDFSSMASGVIYPSFFPTPPQPLDSKKPADLQRQRTSWLFYLAEISLRRLYSGVRQEIIELHRKSSSNGIFLSKLGTIIPEFEAQVQQWCDGLPPELSLQTAPENDDICLFVLRGHFINFFEMIYWPFVMALLSSLEQDLPTDIPAKEFVTKGLATHIRRINVNEPGFLHRHHGTWPMIQSCMRSAIVLLAAHKLGADMPPQWKDGIGRVAQLLSFWEEECEEFMGWRMVLERYLSSTG